MKLRLAGGVREFDVEIVAHGGRTAQVRIDGEEVTAEVEPMPDGSAILRMNGRRSRIFSARSRDSILVATGPTTFEFAPAEGRGRRARHGLATPEVTAPMPGKVLKVLVEEGQAVEAGQPLVVIEAMKMETTLSAESPAVVKKIRARAGEMVDHGAVLIELSPPAASSASESPAPGA
jgi:biotin carboxyl carrier protein